MSLFKDRFGENNEQIERMNDLAFDLTMQILDTGKRDVMEAITELGFQADEHAESLVASINFKSDIEREIAKDCAKAGFLAALRAFQNVCGEVLRPDYKH